LTRMGHPATSDSRRGDVTLRDFEVKNKGRERDRTGTFTTDKAGGSTKKKNRARLRAKVYGHQSNESQCRGKGWLETEAASPGWKGYKLGGYTIHDRERKA